MYGSVYGELYLILFIDVTNVLHMILLACTSCKMAFSLARILALVFSKVQNVECLELVVHLRIARI